MLLTGVQAQYADHIIPGAAQTSRYLPLLKNKRVALLVNQTAMIDRTHLVDSLLKLNVRIQKIFSPEHGFRGNADAGEKVGNSTDPKTGLPIISLYGKHRKATAADLQDVDILIFDIQDVGTRFYTYISSLQELMESAAASNKTLLILDRPNPNGDYVDGPVLDTAYRSFVGMQPIPIVHGMTVAEYARMLNGERWLSKGVQCNIKYIPCENYSHKVYYRLPVKPSPNLPNMAAIHLYPSLCFFEGTAVSLGRGTDKPFQVFGAPGFPKNGYSFTPRSTAGAKDPVLKDQLCYGFDLSNTPEAAPGKDRQIVLRWLIEAYHLYPEKDKFFNPFFNKLAGNATLMQQIKTGVSESDIRKSWEPGLAKFKVIRAKYLLY
ncbi:exo-beta-N-acetylmuramidase NamZ family protein [Chitinophaga nivalis]|uniref:DUF1343 domain-containing protein n=1 Tax=Chitinophaga nivalis TaxID=2991709 RepID=A0ABT3IG35_9BACT|nr:DUF1343 domain-containing protein [Chitinophaga nivalis]MCW3467390.1 DUF1343 domain-containing protein [Chitinophaga nivalis]MCW3482918.1 DUF1343 domain-containing protein [Chitinophaga nivalis]